jgi:Ca2+-binding RTX toxin-like protein
MSGTVIRGDENDNDLRADGRQDTLYGGLGNDTLSAGDSDKDASASARRSLYGEGGNDYIIAGVGKDLLDGGAGSDVVQLTQIEGVGDTLVGGSGADTFRFGYAENATALRFSASDGTASWKAGSLTFSGFEYYDIYGSGANDTVTGGRFDDELTGGAGADKLNGDAGNDTIIGGVGRDSLNGGTGDDLLYASEQGGGYDAKLDGDTLIGGSGSDTLFGSNASDRLEGGAGNDQISCLGGADSAIGGDGDDKITGGSGNAKLLGGAGDDRLSAEGAGKVRADGGTGNDTLIGGIGDTLIGGGGTDTAVFTVDTISSGVRIDLTKATNALPGKTTLQSIEILTFFGGAGADRVVGGRSADTLYGMDGADTLIGGDGADQLAGGLGGDSLSGGAGNDILAAADVGSFFLDTGKNTLDGGSGDDAIYTGGGLNVVTGGAGKDRIFLSSDIDRAERIDGGDGYDVVSYGGDSVHQFQESTRAVTINLLDQSQNARGAAGDRYVGIEGLIGSGNGDSLTGNNGANVLEGGSGDDELSGGKGDDRLAGGQGHDTLTGGVGKDIFVLLGMTARSDDGLPLDPIPRQFDEITDFKAGTDRLEINLAAFGFVDAAAFRVISAKDPVAAGTGAVFLFDSTSHELMLDSDGKGGSDDGTLVAILDGVTKLSASDFLLVSAPLI